MDNLDFRLFCDGCDKSEEFCKARCFTDYRIHHYKKGEVISYKGDLVRDLSIVTNGCVAVSFVLDSGVKLAPRYHNAPYPLGAVALFSPNNHYRVDIVAEQECDVISVSRESVEEHMVICRTFMRNFIAYITSKLDIFAEHISALTYKSLRSKVAYYILTHSKGGKYKFDRGIGELATYLCVERPSLSRTIAQMVDQELITYSRGSGEIKNASALKNLLE